MDFIQDNWKRRGTRPVDKQWTGKTFFRVFGPYDSDYEIESLEVREALTDFEFVGQEKMGDYMVSLFSQEHPWNLRRRQPSHHQDLGER